MHPFLLLIALASSKFEAAAALEQQQHQDRCATNSDMYQCHYDIECIWCEKQRSHGRCMNWTGRPQAGETCDPLVGCGGHRNQNQCDKNAKCKWCTAFTQGWPFCANITEDTHLSASCDKPIPAHPMAAQDVSHPQQPLDRCATISNKYNCHYNIECIWCEKQGSLGRCMNGTGRPQAGETCDPLVGCGGHRTQNLCDKDAKCKWCTEFTQGWPFCANITEDTHLAASCDKPNPAHPTAAQDVSHPLTTAAQEPTMLELIVENKAHSFGKSLYIARGSSSCWGIPGLAPQMDGSYNLVPDEKNTVCPCSKGSSCDYASSILLGFNFDYSWDVLHKFEKQAAQVKWIGHGNRTKDGNIAWTYSCSTLSGSNPSWKVTYRERPAKKSYAKLGYTVTVEDAAAASNYSSSLFLM